MSAWLWAHPGDCRPPIGGTKPRRFSLDPRALAWFAGLLTLLIAQGMALSQAYIWAAPLLGILIVAVAVDVPVLPFLGVWLMVRVLTDASLASAVNRHSGSLNFSGAMAILLILVAAGLALRRRRGLWPTVVVLSWLVVWTAVAARTHGASTETVREGVRELSIVAIAVIVVNARGVLSLSVVTRLIQIVGTASALVAVYQLATHTGMIVGGQIRSNGTFSHPNGASMFYSIAAVASLWRYLDHGRRRIDALLGAICAFATIATFSIGGLASLLVMLLTFGAMRPGALRLKIGACALAMLMVVAFLATPLGAERVSNETTTRFTSTRGHLRQSTSLGWRFYKWTTLIPEWKQSPYYGQGLGTTVTVEGTSENTTAGQVPHNEYVRYLVETGVIGLVLVMAGAVSLLRRLAWRRGLADNAGALGLAVAVGCMFNALGDNTFLYTTTGYAAGLVVAAVLSMPAAGRARSSIRAGDVRMTAIAQTRP